jgi:hypothetical protein
VHHDLRNEARLAVLIQHACTHHRGAVRKGLRPGDEQTELDVRPRSDEAVLPELVGRAGHARVGKRREATRPVVQGVDHRVQGLEGGWRYARYAATVADRAVPVSQVARDCDLQVGSALRLIRVVQVNADRRTGRTCHRLDDQVEAKAPRPRIDRNALIGDGGCDLPIGRRNPEERDARARPDHRRTYPGGNDRNRREVGRRHQPITVGVGTGAAKGRALRHRGRLEPVVIVQLSADLDRVGSGHETVAVGISGHGLEPERQSDSPTERTDAKKEDPRYHPTHLKARKPSRKQGFLLCPPRGYRSTTISAPGHAGAFPCQRRRARAM